MWAVLIQDTDVNTIVHFNFDFWTHILLHTAGIGITEDAIMMIK